MVTNRATRPEASGAPTLDCCVGHRLANRELLKPQLQNTDRLTSARHRREQASAAGLSDHLDGLGGQGLPCGAPANGTRSAVSFPCNRSASTSTAATGGAASPAARNEFRLDDDRRLSPITT
jgi:hypothetical protein